MLRKSLARFLMNEQIFVSRVRLVGSSGDLVSEMETERALQMARDTNMNLVLVQASPPTVTLTQKSSIERDAQNIQKMFAFDASARVKRLIFSVHIGTSDFERKIEELRNFLKKGYRCEIAVRSEPSDTEEEKSALAKRILAHIGDLASDSKHRQTLQFPMHMWPLAQSHTVR